MAARPRVLSVFALLSSLAIFSPILSCSGGGGGTSPEDTTAPAAITDLAVQTVGATSVTLRWTAPGDDGASGQATTYELRSMAGEAAGFSWASATAAAGLPAPHAAGTTQTTVVQGLSTGTTYTFAIKTADEKPNWSAISNLVSAEVDSGATGCQVVPTSLDFGSVSVGASADRTFEITNDGAQPLSGTIAESCDPFTIVSGGGAFNLAASETRTVTVRYAPTAAGSHTCTIDTGADICADVPCAGTATGASSGCAVSPTTLMFPLTGVNNFEVMTFYITNTGSTSITGVIQDGCAAFQVMVGGGGYSLAPGEQRTVIVRFAPSAEGTYNCTLDTGSGDCPDVECSGTCGALPPGCTVSPTVMFFQDTPIGISRDEEFTITNDTDAPISGNIASAYPTFSVVEGAGAYTLQPGEVLTATVRYAPTTHGTHTGVIHTGLPCIDVGCAGTSVEINPDCYVYPLTILNYAKRFVGTWEEKTFFIQNFGTGTLAGTVGSCSAPFEIVSGSGSYSLTTGQSHAVTVRFAPTSAGTYVCEIDTGAGCTNVGCVGTALAADQPLCTIDDTSLTFPETAVGSTRDLTFTIRNSGSGTLTGTVQENCDFFSILSGEGAYALGAGQPHVVTVRYAPTEAGHHSCTIETGSSACSAVECDATATGGSASCRVEPTVLDFPDTQVGGFVQRSFTITNDGTAPLTGTVAESCDGFSFDQGGGPYILDPGASTTVIVLFMPTTEGETACDISTGASCPPVHCTAKAIPPVPICAVFPEGSLAFPETVIGAETTLTFTISNAGPGTLTGTVSEDCAPFEVTEGGGTYTLGASEVQTVTVMFAPLEAGEFHCSINLGASCPAMECTGVGLSLEEMVLVPDGTFTMGSDAGEGEDGERPEHTPYISSFYIDTYEVSNLKYAEALNWAMAHGLVRVITPAPNGLVTNATGAHEQYLFMDQSSSENNQCRVTWDGSSFGVEPGWEDHPVVYVTWWGSAAYCNWRSGMTGRTACYETDNWGCDFDANGYRLPTEAEWEKAARGSADERTFPWGDDAIQCDLCNYGPDLPGGLCVTTTAPVNDPQYAGGVSPYGVWQMAGNVREWCNDWGTIDYYAQSPANDPTGPEFTGDRISRGGSWYNDETHERCAKRSIDGAFYKFDRLGLRTVLRP